MQGIRNLKDLYTFKHSAEKYDGNSYEGNIHAAASAVQPQNWMGVSGATVNVANSNLSNGLVQARVKLPIFSAKGKVPSMHHSTPQPPLTQKKSLNSSKQSSRNNSIFIENSSNGSSAISTPIQSSIISAAVAAAAAAAAVGVTSSVTSSAQKHIAQKPTVHNASSNNNNSNYQYNNNLMNSSNNNNNNPSLLRDASSSSSNNNNTSSINASQLLNQQQQQQQQQININSFITNQTGQISHINPNNPYSYGSTQSVSSAAASSSKPVSDKSKQQSVHYHSAHNNNNNNNHHNHHIQLTPQQLMQLQIQQQLQSSSQNTFSFQTPSQSLHSSHQVSPSPSPHPSSSHYSQSNQQQQHGQFSGRSTRRDYGGGSQIIAQGTTPVTGLGQTQMQLYHQQQQLHQQLQQQQQQIYLQQQQQQSYYHPSSQQSIQGINNHHLINNNNNNNNNNGSVVSNIQMQASSSIQNSSYSRNNSRNDRSIDRIDSHRPDSQRDRSASGKPHQQQGATYRQPSQSKQPAPVVEQPLLEKYKGTPFLNYIFLNNFQANDQLQQNSQQQQQPLPPRSSSKNSARFAEGNNNNNNNNANNNISESRQEPSPRLMSSIEPKDGNQFGSVNRNQFNFHYVIGKGGFGKVWKVDSKKTKKVYAMKEMSKSKIITKRSVNSVMSERQLLSQLKNPFLVNMNFAFQDRDNLYLVMDLLTGGDLRFHIGKQQRFSEAQTRFFIACMMQCLEYLHVNNIIHRDIKPENLVIDDMGYVRVTDLGIARVWKPENSQDTSGTPGYMAPEVMCRQNHGIAVDYFAVGVIGYEFMLGRRPYLGRSRKEIRDQILSKQVQIKKHEIPDGWSIEAADFINRMIQRKPMNRLGINGPEEVKNHPWLRNFPWQKLQQKELESPFIPKSIEDNYDYRQQISLDGRDTNEDLLQQNGLLLRRNSVQNLFAGYNFEAAVQAKRQTSYGSRTGSTAATHNTFNSNSERSNSTLQNYLNSNTGSSVPGNNVIHPNIIPSTASIHNSNHGSINSSRILVKNAQGIYEEQ